MDQPRQGSLQKRPQPAGDDIAAFIRTSLHIASVPIVPEIRLYTAHPGSGLRRFLEASGDHSTSPYWAYPWSGGLALARYLLDNLEIAAGRKIVDLGAGCGLVGIAAMKAGATTVTAVDIDQNACAAARLNFELNGVAGEIIAGDLLDGPAPQIDLMLVGDLFYDAKVAQHVTAFLDRCAQAGIDILIGDPGRAWLPHDQLRQLAQYPIPDFGAAKAAFNTFGYVFAFDACK